MRVLGWCGRVLRQVPDSDGLLGVLLRGWHSRPTRPHPSYPSWVAEDVADPADNGQLERLRAEARAQTGIEHAARLAEALTTIEDATGQVSPRVLPFLAEHLGRVYSRALARLRVEEREAVRAAVRTAREAS